MCPWRVRGVTIKFDQLGLYSHDCFTGELQPQTSENITDLEKVLSTTGLALNLLIMLLLLLGDSLTFGKEAVSQVIYGCYKLQSIYNHKPQIQQKILEIPGAVLHKLSQKRGYYRELSRHCLNS